MRYHPHADLTFILLWVCFLNLCCLGVAAFLTTQQIAAESRVRLFNWIAFGVALSSQALYLVMVAVWWFQWMKFYPGNPTEIATILSGFVLSFAAVLSASRAHGFMKFAAIFVGFTMGLLWLLSAVASVAV